MTENSKEQRATRRRGKPFKKGQSGNPGGRPKVLAEVRELARGYTQAAIDLAATIMRDPDEDGRTRLAAAQLLLDRGWGKPEQAIVGGVQIEHRYRLNKDQADAAYRAAGVPIEGQVVRHVGHAGEQSD